MKPYIKSLGEKYTKEKVNQMYGEMHRQSYRDDD